MRRICMLWHMCLSLWHQLWYQFGVSIDDVSGDIYGDLLHLMMWRWWWHLDILVLFCTKLRRWLVSHINSRRWKLVLTSGQWSCRIYCGGLSLPPPSYIWVRFGVWRACWWRIHHISLGDSLIWSGSTKLLFS